MRPFSPAGPEHILIRPPSNDMKVQGKGEEHLNITQRPRRGATEHPQRTHRGLTEDSQRTRKGLAKGSQRIRRGPTVDSQRTHRGPTEDSKRIHKGFLEDLPSEAVLDTGFNMILPA